MQSEQLPPRPDFRPEFATPAPKKRWTWWKIGLVILGLYIAGDVLVQFGSVTDKAETSPVAPVESDSNLEIARTAWDQALSPSEQADLCDYYNTPPVGITPPLVRAFDEGAGLGYAESERVLGVLLAEEC